MKFTGQPTRSVELDATHWAYLAGVLDSDGCISANSNGNCRTVRPYVAVIQRDMLLIEYLYSTFGGRVDINGRKRPDGRSHWYYRWDIFNANAYQLLKGCLPYMKVKRRQAELAILLIDSSAGKRSGKYFRYPQEIIDYQQSLKSEIKSLNTLATTERDTSLTKEMRQSELTQMINREKVRRSACLANEKVII